MFFDICPRQSVHFRGGYGPNLIATPSIHGFLDPHESFTNGISISSAVSAQLTYVPNTHRHTDHATSVAIGRIYVRKSSPDEAREPIMGRTCETGRF